MDFVRWEVEQVSGLGIDLLSNAQLGKDLYNRLRKEFDAIYVSPRKFNGGNQVEPIETISNVYIARDLLMSIKSNRAPALFGQVVIIGGGIWALKAARAVKKSGGHPLIVYSGSLEDAQAIADEAVLVEKEGIEFQFQTGVVGLVEDSGQIKGLMCSKIELGDTAKTRRYTAQLSAETSFEIQANQVIIALGRNGNLSFLPARIQESGFVVIDDDQTLLAARKRFEKRTIDLSRTIIREIASGKRTAFILDLYFRHLPFDMIERFVIGRLKGLSMEAYRRELEEGLTTRSMNQVVRPEELNLAYFGRTSRSIPSFASNEFSKHQASISARRCFNCGTCTFCYKCYDFCPDLAIHMDGTAKYREIDYDHCKGCGICIEECPRSAISWARD
jgi:Pyruvate/2-oxoacid:ferredoxin oxidoreductase delta subunit